MIDKLDKFVSETLGKLSFEKTIYEIQNVCGIGKKKIIQNLSYNYYNFVNVVVQKIIIKDP